MYSRDVEKLAFLYPTGRGPREYRAAWDMEGGGTITADSATQQMSISISLPLNIHINLQEDRSRMFSIVLFIIWKIKMHANAHQQNSSTNYKPTTHKLLHSRLEEQVILIGHHVF